MKTITYNPAVYKLVPIEPDVRMKAIGCASISEVTSDNCGERVTPSTYDAQYVYEQMVSQSLDNTPGVVTHSGEPVAYAWYHRGNVNFDDQGDLSLFDDEKGTPIPLFTHPEPDALAIVKATLEAAILACEKESDYYAERDNDIAPELQATAATGCDSCVDSLYNINPQGILDSL